MKKLETRARTIRDPHVLQFRKLQPDFLIREVEGGTWEHKRGRSYSSGESTNKWAIKFGVVFLLMGFVGFYVSRVWRRNAEGAHMSRSRPVRKKSPLWVKSRH